MKRICNDPKDPYTLLDWEAVQSLALASLNAYDTQSDPPLPDYQFVKWLWGRNPLT